MVKDFWLTDGEGVNLMKLIDRWDGAGDGEDYAGFAELFGEEAVAPGEAKVAKLVAAGR
jgi:hypothetical protein